MIDSEDKAFSYKFTEQYKLSFYKKNIAEQLSTFKKNNWRFGQTRLLHAEDNVLIDAEIKAIMKTENDIVSIFQPVKQFKHKV